MSFSHASMVLADGAAQASKAQPLKVPGLVEVVVSAANDRVSGQAPRAAAVITAEARRRVLGEGTWLLLD